MFKKSNELGTSIVIGQLGSRFSDHLMILLYVERHRPKASPDGTVVEECGTCKSEELSGQNVIIGKTTA